MIVLRDCLLWETEAPTYFTELLSQEGCCSPRAWIWDAVDKLLSNLVFGILCFDVFPHGHWWYYTTSADLEETTAVLWGQRWRVWSSRWHFFSSLLIKGKCRSVSFCLVRVIRRVLASMTMKVWRMRNAKERQDPSEEVGQGHICQQTC